MADHARTGGAHSARLPTVLAVVLALALPAVFVGNALVVLVHPWLVQAQYSLPGFPDDPLGLSDGERSDLGVEGLLSIRPWDGEGIERLRVARLPGGAPAFDAREVAHMSDVRGVFEGFMLAWLVGLVVLAVTAVALGRGSPAMLRRGLGWGAGLTIALFGALALLMLVGFDAFFTSFHGVFFEGDSWRFASDDTLLGLYPDEFWTTAAAAAAGLVLIQAAVVMWVARRQ